MRGLVGFHESEKGGAAVQCKDKSIGRAASGNVRCPDTVGMPYRLAGIDRAIGCEVRIDGQPLSVGLSVRCILLLPLLIPLHHTLGVCRPRRTDLLTELVVASELPLLDRFAT